MARAPFWRRASLLLLSAAALSLLVLSLACGGGDDAPTETTPDGAGSGDGGPVTFDVSMGDNFFVPPDFVVPAGATVTFNFTNEGVAIHNMRIAGEDGEYYTDDDDVSNPDLIRSGGKGVLEWTAPDTPGEVLFQCDLHPTDSFGTITVE